MAWIKISASQYINDAGTTLAAGSASPFNATIQAAGAASPVTIQANASQAAAEVLIGKIMAATRERIIDPSIL